MQIYYPEYYERFRCVAGACPDSCCKEWAVDVDAKSAAYYRSLPGALGDRLREVLADTEDGTVMQIENGRCPMWRQDGLCRIHAELGHEALCKTCREFPRLRHDYGDFVELGLELSCPEAARLILTSCDHEMKCVQTDGGEVPEYDREVMGILQSSRGEVLEFLTNTQRPVSESLAVILLHSHSVQAWMDGGEEVRLEPESCLADARRYAAAGDIGAVFGFFRELEILTPRWRDRLAQPQQPAVWTAQLQALARYMIERYWLQAVSDYDLVCRVKLCVVSCLLVGAMGGDVIQTAQLFSKEIENDPDNLESVLDGAYTATALTDANLLGLLLNKKLWRENDKNN